MFPVTSTYTVRGGRVKGYFILPLHFSIDIVRVMVAKYSIAKNTMDEKFWPLASTTNYLMPESKSF